MTSHEYRCYNNSQLYCFVAIDRTRKLALAPLVLKANLETVREFLELLLEAVRYKIHAILIDNGGRSAEQPRNCDSLMFSKMGFDLICEANGINYPLTKPDWCDRVWRFTQSKHTRYGRSQPHQGDRWRSCHYNRHSIPCVKH